VLSAVTHIDNIQPHTK